MTAARVSRPVLHPALCRPAQILLVEDSPSDAAMTVAALEEGWIIIDLHVVLDGEAAMDFLLRRGEFSDAPRPDLIILDLNLPKKDGREVLAEVKADEALRSIPVAVLTTSAAEADVLRAYSLHANSYITKPVAFEQFLATIHQIEDYWLSLVRLPDIGV